jgi:hypothetical protein
MNILRLSRFVLVGALTLGLNTVSLYAVSDTVASFGDVEDSTGNVFESGELDLSLSDVLFDGDISSDIEESRFSTTVSATTSGAVAYGLAYAYGSGSLCDALAVNVSGGETTYTGLLTNLAIASTTELGLWEFSVGLGGGTGVKSGDSCAFDLVYDARFFVVPDGGYADQERLRVTITYDGGVALDVATEVVVIDEQEQKQEPPLPEEPKDELLIVSEEIPRQEPVDEIPSESSHNADTPPVLPVEETVLLREEDEQPALTEEASVPPTEPEDLVPSNESLDVPVNTESADVVFVPVQEPPPVSEPGEPVIQF